MRTRLVAILFILLIAGSAFAQRGIKNNGAKLIVGSGAIINVTGGSNADFTNASGGGFDGRVDLDGKIKLEGDWANNATAGNVFINTDTDGEVAFTGTSTHSISGSQTNFEQLTLNTTGNTTLGVNTSVGGNLNLTSGLLSLGSYNLTLAAGSSVSGTPDATKMIVATSTGEVRKTFTGTGSFTFPVGDNTGTAEYSPVTLNFTSGTFGSSAYAGVKLSNTKHPSNSSTTGYINRYWSVSQSNISGFSCGFTGTYNDADIYGTESLLFGGYYNSPNWMKMGTVNTSSNQITGTFSAFYPVTAGDQAMFCTSTITINEVITNVLCYGNSTGAIDVSVTGGVSPYTYNWSGTGVSVTAEDQSGLVAGTYYLTVTDVNGCTQTDVFSISQPSAALATSYTKTNVACYGSSTGAIDLTVTGGTPGYTYTWSNSATSQDLSSISAGTYNVTVKDINNCSTTNSVTITQPASALSVSATQTNVSCFGGSNGTIDITASGGTTPYGYNWGGGATSEDRSGLIAGTYTVTVTDGNACTSVKPVTITQPSAALAVVVTTQTNVNCYGQSTGAINITASGGTVGTGYTYNWSGGVTTEDRTNIPAGTYSVTVTDANSCTASTSATITQPSAALAVAVTSQTNVNCFGASTGSINITATGGTPTYTYNWGGGVTSEDRTSIPAGTYAVTVTDTKGCTANTSATITQQTDIVATVTVTDATCYNLDNGSATVSASGGSGSYTYNWDDPSFQSTATATALLAGTYHVTVTDGYGCTENGTAVISQPTEMTVSTSSTQQSSCSTPDGTATADLTGGTSPYDYIWSNGDNTLATGALSNTINGLASGAYGVTVTDANGCSVNGTANVSAASSPTLVVNTQNNVSCNGGNDGSINVVAFGGTSPYTFDWAPNGFTGDGSATYSNLTAGVYTCTVTDFNGCSASIAATITQPAILNASVTAFTNVSCNGGNNGSATVTVSGGTIPYSYDWSPNGFIGDGTATYSTLTAGTYSVVITDSKLCNKTVNVTITEPSALSATLNATNVACFGDATGSIDVTAAGGVTPYTYTWTNSETTEDLFGLIAGAYTVTVKDANLCQFVSSVTITEPADALSASITGIDVNCFNGNDGEADLTVTGGTTPYAFDWSNSSTNEDLTGLTAGIYNVNVTDNNMCTATASVTILQPAASLSASVVKTDVDCNGNSTGSIDLTVEGGTTPYTYSWSNTSTSEDLNNIFAGTYTVTVTDDNGCTANAETTITEPSALVVIVSKTDVSCNGGSNGSANLAVTGGSVPYSFYWSNSAVDQDINNLVVGDYYVTVTDANGCSVEESVTISQPSALTLNINGTDVTCFGGSDGGINTTVSGGITPYTYLWNDNSNLEDRANVYAGVFTVSVTDANGCVISNNYTVNQPEELVLDFNATDMSCYGVNDGTINMTVTGGTSPYNYEWSNTLTTQDLTGLNADTYFVTVTDNHSCQILGNAIISEPEQITLSVSSTDETCSSGNGEASVTIVSGGVVPFNYAWNTTPVQTTSTAIGLVAGSYDVTVTDFTGCSASINVTINNIAGPTLTTSAVNLLCNSICNGSATVNVSGGTTPYTYSWSDALHQSSSTATNLCAGSFDVTVTDAIGCKENGYVTITEPTAIAASFDVTNPSCYGICDGEILTSVTGGVTPYTYLWSNSSTNATNSSLCAGSYTVTVKDANNCNRVEVVSLTSPSEIAINGIVSQVSCNAGNDGQIDITVSGGVSPYSFDWSGTTTEDITGLVAGNYIVTVTDNTGCQNTASFDVAEPNALALTFTVSNVSCNGMADATVDAVVTGGTTSYSYSWEGGETTSQLVNVAAGSYNVTVTDANNCQISGSASVTEPDVLTLSAVASDITCNGAGDGAIDVTVAGGTPGYIFDWSNSAASEDLTDLVAGTYSLTVYDDYGCSVNTDVTISEPVILQLSYSVTNEVSGNDGTIDLTVTGGTTPYSFLWSNTETSEDLTGLTSGIYNVTVTDFNNCQETASIIVNNDACLSISLDVTGTNLSCYDSYTGQAEATVTGGTSPYSYQWNNSETMQTITGLAAGNYSVTVIDALNCILTGSINLTEPTQLIISDAVITGVSCNGNNDGSIDITINGGVTPYIIDWDNSATTEDISGLAGGQYIVSITDANNCMINQSYYVSEPDVFEVTAYKTDITCFGMNNGTVYLSVNGGTMPYSYLWNNTETTPDLTDLIAGNYSVTVTDNNGCQVTISTDITEPTELSETNTVTNVSCNGLSDGAVDITAFGGVSPYNFEWSNGAVVEDINMLVAGIYQVTITDANGCQLFENYNVTEPTAIVLAYTFTNETVAGNDGSIDLTVSGGQTPYNYLWDDAGASTSEDLSGLAAGIYTVVVTDANACTNSVSVLINNDACTMTVDLTKTDVTCNGAADGSITATVSAGTSPYVYTWSNSETTDVITNLAVGTYTLTVEDAMHCFTEASITLTQPDAINIAYLISNVQCNGLSNGGIDITVTGGVSPYSYNWTGNISDEDLADLAAGTYDVTVIDNNNCAETASIIVNQPDAINISSVITNEFAGNDGAVDITVTGGTTPYTFNWSNTETTEDITGLVAGSYDVTVTDFNGCTAFETFTVSNISCDLAATVSTTNVSCYGGVNGSASVSITGGTTPYTISWFDLSAGTSIADLSVGDYDVTVNDANGCSVVETFTITQPDWFNVNVNITNVSCNGLSDGAFELLITGGTTPYDVVWTNGGTGLIQTNLTAGDYTGTLTDANGCQDVGTVTIAEPEVLTASSIISNALCNGSNNGAIDVTVTGGTTPYSFLWSDNQITEDINGLVAGAYDVTITDFNGCIFELNNTVTEPEAISIANTIIPDDGTANGAIDVTVIGGTSPYSFNWSNTSVDEDLTGLTAGIYNLTVTDLNSCQAFGTYVVNNTACNMTVDFDVVNVNCYGTNTGTVTATVVNGTSPYTVQWSNAATDLVNYDLVAGQYIVTVTDANACIYIDSVIVTEPDEILVSAVVSDVTCNGAANGAIDLTVSGGTTPYTFSWTPVNSSDEDLTNLAPDYYVVTVEDANGCWYSNTYIITEPTVLDVQVSAIQNALCNGTLTGNVDIAVAGGTSPYSYNWSNGETTEDLALVGAGTYDLQVTDFNGCTNTVNAVVTEPDVIVISGVVYPEDAGNDGAVDITVTGGTTPYTFNWSNMEITEDISSLPAGVYTVDVIDFNGCTENETFVVNNVNCQLTAAVVTENVSCFGLFDGRAYVELTNATEPYSVVWNTTEVTDTISDLSAGTYTVTVTDNASCVALASGIVSQPDALTLVLSQTEDNGSNNGTATVAITGGTPAYTIVWDDPLAQTTETAVDLVGGIIYTVYVTDANGCMANDTITVPLNIFVNNVFVSMNARVYPVPMKNNLNISINSTGNMDVRIELYNELGAIVRNINESVVAGENYFETPVSKLANGVYYVRISANGFNNVVKVVKVTE